MFLTPHLSWQALRFSLCVRELKPCQKNPGICTHLCLSHPPWNPAMGVYGAFPPFPQMSANKRNTCAVNIYRIICLLIIRAFQIWTLLFLNLRHALDFSLKQILKNGLCHVKWTFLWLWESVENPPIQLLSLSTAACMEAPIEPFPNEEGPPV